MKKRTIILSGIVAVTLLTGCSQNPVSVGTADTDQTTASLASSQMQLLLLTQRKANIEYQLQLISQQRNSLLKLESSLSPIAGNVALKNQLLAQDNQLSLQQIQLQTQQKELAAELDAVNTIINKNISQSFKVFQ